MKLMHPACPRCGSDAAVTWTTAADGTHYTCRFSHDGEGPVSWLVPAKATRAPRAASTSTPRAPRTPAAPRAPRTASESRPLAAPPAPPAPKQSVNDKGVAAVVQEIVKRGGHARVVQDGSRREVVVTRDGRDDAVRLVVRARIGGSWQTRASIGEPRAEEEHPDTFWVLVHFTMGKALCYVVPEWWLLNDISEKHDEYLSSRDTARSVAADSDHHSIGTDRVAQWLDRWEQLDVLTPDPGATEPS